MLLEDAVGRPALLTLMVAAVPSIICIRAPFDPMK